MADQIKVIRTFGGEVFAQVDGQEVAVRPTHFGNCSFHITVDQG